MTHADRGREIRTAAPQELPDRHDHEEQSDKQRYEQHVLMDLEPGAAARPPSKRQHHSNGQKRPDLSTCAVRRERRCRDEYERTGTHLTEEHQVTHRRVENLEVGEIEI